jgi:DNA-binding transcriptional LysR family regulator
MRRRLPPLSTLRAFEATARLGSVSRAAEELGRTHGAVSRQLRTLQEHLQAPVFEKAGVGLRLNTRGAALQAVVAEAFDRLEAGWTRAAEGDALHVACSATFATRWLAARLGDFYRGRPEVKVRLSMTSAAEMRRQGADLVIAWDLEAFPPAERARAVRLAPAAFGPVCAPAYAWRPPADGRLDAACRIAHDFTSRAWDRWSAATGVAVAATSELSFPHTHLCLEAAVAGQGVAMVERRMAAEDLAGGRLVAPLGFTPFEEGVSVIPAADVPPGSPAAAFIDWLRSALAA